MGARNTKHVAWLCRDGPEAPHLAPRADPDQTPEQFQPNDLQSRIPLQIWSKTLAKTLLRLSVVQLLFTKSQPSRKSLLARQRAKARVPFSSSWRSQCLRSETLVRTLNSVLHAELGASKQTRLYHGTIRTETEFKQGKEHCGPAKVIAQAAAPRPGKGSIMIDRIERDLVSWAEAAALRRTKSPARSRP